MSPAPSSAAPSAAARSASLPGATLVVAKALSGQGSGDGSLLIAAAQWMMDPDGDPATADYPTVISNSWVSPAATDTWFLPMVRAWRALGIVPVFAAGNTAGAGTVGSPASYSESVAVGAVDDDKALADFSSQGPITWAAVNDEGLAPGTVVGKPDLVAPGRVRDVLGARRLRRDVRHLDGSAARRRRRRPAASGRSEHDRRPGHRDAQGDRGRSRPRRPGQPVRRGARRCLLGRQVRPRSASHHGPREGARRASSRATRSRSSSTARAPRRSGHAWTRAAGAPRR